MSCNAYTSRRSMQMKLRRRRGWNTTTDCFVEDDIPCVVISEVDDRLNSSESSEESSSYGSYLIKDYRTRQRHVENIYCKDEPNENTKCTPPIKNDRFMTKAAESRTKAEQSRVGTRQAHSWLSVNHRTVILLFCITIILLFIIIYVSLQKSTQSSTGVAPVDRSVTSLQQLTDELSSEFPHQPARLWAQLRAALEPQSAHYGGAEESSNAPSVILLAQAVPSGPGGGLTDKVSQLQHFVARLGEQINRLLLGQPTTGCREIRVQGEAAASAEKLLLDQQLQQLYSEGFRCIHFHRIDRLSHGTAVFFHGAVDATNSFYRNLIFILTLETVIDTSESLPELGPRVSGHKYLQQLEHRVSCLLRSLWTPSLGLEEADALLSRITPNTMIFHVTQ